MFGNSKKDKEIEELKKRISQLEKIVYLSMIIDDKSN